MMKIYHNPRCKKSRETLALLQENGIDPEVVLYLKTPPTEDEIRGLLLKLEMRADELVRKKDKLYKEKFAAWNMNDDELIRAMAENPSLIERPIVVQDHNAVIGRPPEKVLDLLELVER